MLVNKRASVTNIRFSIGECSLGFVLVASSDVGICAIALDDQQGVLLAFLAEKFPASQLQTDSVGLAEPLSQIIAKIEQPNTEVSLPLDMQGTDFQLKVWQALCEIPCGSTVSYLALAALIGLPRAVRAVAGACAANKLAVLVPCHRIIKNDGGLSGYRWGITRKAELLRREQAGSVA